MRDLIWGGGSGGIFFSISIVSKSFSKCFGVSFVRPILVGGLEHEFYDFPYVGNVIIPTDELIFFRGVRLNHQPAYVLAND